MGRQLALVSDPAERYQAFAQILGAINRGELIPPESDQADFLYILLNPH